MKTLQMPASYAALSEQEQQNAVGGGELFDALGNFFSSIHLDDLMLGNAFFALSFTFVPALLFNVVRVGFGLAKTIYHNISGLLGLREQAQNAMAKLDLF